MKITSLIYLMQVITRNDIHLLEHCFTTFLTEEPEHSTYGMDVDKDKEYYVKVCNEKLFLDEAPQFILWDNNEKTVIPWNRNSFI